MGPKEPGKEMFSLTSPSDVDRLIRAGVIAVIRADTEEVALRLADALIKGGIKALEVTFTVPRAHRVLESLSRRAQEEDLIVGAGTVLDSETARISILAGARFVVTPVVALDVIQTAHRHNVIAMPGASTPTEVFQVYNAGVRMVKVFPANVLGPTFIRAIRPLFPGLLYIPTGGVATHNVRMWLDAGAVAVGVGSELTSPAQRGDYEEVTRRAQAFINAIRDVGA